MRQIVRPRSVHRYNMIRIAISYHKTNVRIQTALIKKAITATCRALSVEHASFAIHLTNDKEVQKLNAQYRKMNKPTDVLSFPVNEKHTGEGEEKYMGEIILGFPYITKQAHAKKVSVSEEVQMLLIHGVLHVHGFDHESDRDEKKMFTIQNKIAQKIGAPIVDPTKL